MNRGEYDVMARAEEEHWWYRGLRAAIGSILGEPRFRLPTRPRLLDAGCGTGANLRLLGERLAPSYLGGFDCAEAALERARVKVPTADLYASDLRDPEVRVPELDLVLSADVVCQVGVERCRDGLGRLVDRLRTGGLLLLNLPAYEWLRSEHDVAVHCTERYTASRVRSLLDSLGLEVELLSYRMCVLFPAVVLARLPSLGRRVDAERARSDLTIPPSAVANRVLAGVVAAEGRLLARGVPLPFGSSVIAVGRRA